MAVSAEQRKKFERLGKAVVLRDVGLGFHLESNAEQHAAVEWLAEKDREAARRARREFLAILVLTAIAAMGSAVAAWPIVKAWLA